jgi:hypothetical protein
VGVDVEGIVSFDLVYVVEWELIPVSLNSCHKPKIGFLSRVDFDDSM